MGLFFRTHTDEGNVHVSRLRESEPGQRSYGRNDPGSRDRTQVG